MIVDLLEDKKAENIVLLDLRPDTILADFFVVCTGNGDRHLNALRENIRDEVKEKTRRVPQGSEGTPESGWILMDYGSVIVHLFTDDKREFYDLEGFWAKSANVLLSIQ